MFYARLYMNKGRLDGVMDGRGWIKTGMVLALLTGLRLEFSFSLNRYPEGFGNRFQLKGV